MWRSHMVVGASSWLAAQTLAGPLLGAPLNTSKQACGAAVAAGAALLCDMDTPGSRLANTLGPVTRLVARLIGRAFGGHRHGTHSLLFCAAIGALSTVTLVHGELVHISAGVTLSVGADPRRATGATRHSRRRARGAARRRRGVDAAAAGAHQRRGDDRVRIAPACGLADTRRHPALVALLAAAHVAAAHQAHRRQPRGPADPRTALLTIAIAGGYP
jgi:hypothetical protein